MKPGDIIILDDATFHKGKSIREVVEKAGCELWYLPAYSPDLNKIENWWSVLKTCMKQRLKKFETVRDCVDAASSEGGASLVSGVKAKIISLLATYPLLSCLMRRISFSAFKSLVKVFTVFPAYALAIRGLISGIFFRGIGSGHFERSRTKCFCLVSLAESRPAKLS